jgi:ferredoxin
MMRQTSKSELIEVILDDDTSQAIAHNGVKIVIDRNKCNYSMYDPTGCKKCLLACPAGVFCTRPLEKRDYSIPPRERVDPTQWVILATWADWCNGCGACIEECPKDAIAIQLGDRTIGG